MLIWEFIWEIRYDSDTVSCVANLANLKIIEKDGIDFTVVNVEDFNELDIIDRLVNFIRVEKPHFRPVVRPEHLRTILCIKPKYNNHRIVAQAGAFLLFGLTGELLDANHHGRLPKN